MAKPSQTTQVHNLLDFQHETAKSQTNDQILRIDTYFTHNTAKGLLLG